MSEEEEWPSLGLVTDENEESEKSAEGSVVGKEEELVSEEEEWPKANVILGLNTPVRKSSLHEDRPRSQPMSEVNDSSSLGELRFKDE